MLPVTVKRQIPSHRFHAGAVRRGFCRLSWKLTVLFLVCNSIGAQPPPSGSSPLAGSAVSGVVNKYCLNCHDREAKKGGLDLESLSHEPVAQNSDAWERVVRKMRARQMPPLGKDRPNERTYDTVVNQLASSLDRASAKHPNPGRTETLRRLNRIEYQNAIRDLLALDIDSATLLPKDDASHGFDNVTVGVLSPTLLDRYISAAQKISRLAIGAPRRAPGGDTIRIRPDVTQEEHVEGLPLGTRGGALLPYTFPRDGEYEIQIRLTRDRNEEVEGLREAHELEVLLDRERVKLFNVAPPKGDKNFEKVDAHLKARIPVTAGPHQLGVTFLKNPSELLETKRQPYNAHFNTHRHPRITPAIYQISINGPYESKGPGDTPSRRRILGEWSADASSARIEPTRHHADEASALRILSTLMRRAYRRPVAQADLERPMEFFRKAQAEQSGVRPSSGAATMEFDRRAPAEQGFDAGIEAALASVLVSPEFLFRIELDPAGLAPNTAYRISDLALASRLSFFLWSSIPDDELLETAIRGELHRPKVLEKQVRRMLADGRSRNLAGNFAEQWLYLRNLESMTPELRLFPDFDDNLRQAFRQETELFFESVLREDRSVLDLLKADYTFLNERLAKHYGIPNLYGSRFRRVSFAGGAAPSPLGGERAWVRGSSAAVLSKNGGTTRTLTPSLSHPMGEGVQPGHNSERGGLLRQGSILTVTSYATRTSPVIRGKWILENLLGTPPPPPLPDVPALKDNTVSATLSVRERLAEHRSKAVCASCHNLMDPIGFSLENFDAIGRWRTVEDGQPLDCSGGLPDGSKFTSVSGLEEGLRKRPELFVGTLTEKLMTFALGRGIETYDAPAVRKIVRDARVNDFRFSSVILGIVNSTPFQMRRASN